MGKPSSAITPIPTDNSASPSNNNLYITQLSLLSDLLSKAYS